MVRTVSLPLIRCLIFRVSGLLERTLCVLSQIAPRFAMYLENWIKRKAFDCGILHIADAVIEGWREKRTFRERDVRQKSCFVIVLSYETGMLRFEYKMQIIRQQKGYAARKKSVLSAATTNFATTKRRTKKMIRTWLESWTLDNGNWRLDEGN